MHGCAICSNPQVVFWGFTALKIVLVFVIVISAVALYGLAERRFSAFMQDRLGPNRCGPFGLLTPLADGVKFLFKEDVIPNHVDKVLYVLAPVLTVIPAFMTVAVVPFGQYVRHNGQTYMLEIADFNIGILYILGIVSLGVYGIAVGGWASRNKYALMGGVRSAAQMISYELSMGLSIIGVLIVYESLSLRGMVEAQSGMISFLPFLPKWGVFVQPLAFVIFMIAAYAETNRVPFDIPEAEAEIVAGYHLEYSSMKFALFVMGEYSNMVTSSAVVATLFFGGWLLPVPAWNAAVNALHPMATALINVGVFSGKVCIFAFLFIWVRWTLPRFRYDKVMQLGWKVLMPLALFNIFATATFYLVKYYYMTGGVK